MVGLSKFPDLRGVLLKAGVANGSELVGSSGPVEAHLAERLELVVDRSGDMLH